MNRNRYVFFLLLMLGPLMTGSGCSNKAKKAEEYAIRAKFMGDIIITQASACINQSKAYVTVWEYSKVTGEDFKTSARHILGNQAQQNKIEFLSMKQEIAERLAKLEKIPEQYVSAHEKLIDLHDLYLQLHALALNPTPPQETYEKSVNELAEKTRNTGEEFYSLLGI